MKSNDQMHLSPEQLNWAIIDPEDLTAVQRSHLSACRRCAAAKSEIEQTLSHLGNKAKQYAPNRKKRMILLSEKADAGPSWLKRWPFSIAVAAASLALFAVIWGSDLMQPSPTFQSKIAVDDASKTDLLITEVSILLDNALPQTYLEICAESGWRFDDQFVEYIVPLGADDHLSKTIRMKGVQSC